MDIVLGVLGVSLLIVVSIDILWTTLLIAGGGPLTNRLVSAVWSFLLLLNNKTRKLKVLPFGGLAIILVNLLCWVGLIYLGWVLIFCSHEQAVLHGKSMLPANLSSRIYYTGYTLITLGIGDYVPGTAFWQFITIIASANGFIFVTLVITYLLPIVSSVVQKRQFGGYIFSLGATPTGILNNAWNGHDYGALSSHFSSLALQVLELGQKHLAYPILHCFHTPERQSATAPNIAALDEALSILEYGVPLSQQPNKLCIATLRNAISLFLGNRKGPSLKNGTKVPTIPDLRGLLANESTPAQFITGIKAIEKRRQLLNSLLEHDGWHWDAVITPPKISNKDLLANPTSLNKPIEE